MPAIDPARWATLSSYLDELLLLPPPDRDRRLSEIAAEDAATSADLRELLDARDGASRAAFLGGVAAPSLFPVGVSAGEALGPWTLVEPIGEGGMGSVWRARRSDGRFEGEAAIKLLRSGLFDAGAQERFRREGAILARLRHPGIAQLLDAGVTERGQPYLVLELVRGERIDHWCRSQGLSVRQRIELFLQVLEAVSAAHAQLAIHRDLKPSNVLVDGDGRVKLLDFGIARLLPGAQAEQTALTREGGLTLTPEYAAPEQFADGPLSVATDVYTLGVLLFELLVGAHPSGLVPGAGALLYLRAATEGHFTLPSLAAPALRTALRGDIDNILAKALRVVPSERYASAAAFAEDLRAHLQYRPVSARPDSWLYRLARFTRRHRATVALGTLACAAVLAGVIGTVQQAHEATIQSQRATRQELRALAAAAESERLRGVAQTRSAAALAAAAEAASAAARAEQQSRRADAQAAASLQIAETARQQRDRALSELDNAESASQFVAYLLTVGGDRPVTAAELLRKAGGMIAREYRDDPQQRAQLLLLVAEQYGELGNASDAVPLVEQARGAARQARSTPLNAEVDCVDALLKLHAGDASAALALIDGALPIMRAVPDANPLALANCSTTRSFANRMLGHTELGLADAQYAVRLLAHPTPGQLVAAINARAVLGQALSGSGRTAEAVREMQRVLKELDDIGRSDTAMAGTVVNNLGTVLSRGGQIRDAVQAFERSLALAARTTGAGVDTVTAANLAGGYSQLGRHAQALALLEQARQQALTQPGPRLLGTVLLRIAGTHCAAGQTDLCASELAAARRQLVPVLPPNHGLLAQMELLDARIALTQQQPAAALPALARAAAMFEANKEATGPLRVLELQARAERMSGRLDVARIRVDAALTQARRLSEGFATSVFVGQTLLEDARLRLAEGNRASAAASAAEALRQLQASIGDAAEATGEARTLVSDLR